MANGQVVFSAVGTVEFAPVKDGRNLRPVSRHSVPLELVHSDLHGPLPPTANGYKYWVSFTDDASRF